MNSPEPRPRRGDLCFAAGVAALFALPAALLTLAPQAARAFDPLNPFDSFTDSGPVTPEEREQREQMRADLYDRLSPSYRIDVPFVSEASVAALQQAIDPYRSDPTGDRPKDGSRPAAGR